MTAEEDCNLRSKRASYVYMSAIIERKEKKLDCNCTLSSPPPPPPPKKKKSPARLFSALSVHSACGDMEPIGLALRVSLLRLIT